MPVASTVKRLPQPVRDEIHSLLDNGRTLDEIIAHLRALGVDQVSRSALGRYAKNFNAVVERVRRSREIADALVRNFGQEDESKAARANIEMMHAVVSNMLLHVGDDDSEDGQGLSLDAKQAQALSSAMANLARARRLDQDAIIKAREEAAGLHRRALSVDGGDGNPLPDQGCRRQQPRRLGDLPEVRPEGLCGPEGSGLPHA